MLMMDALSPFYKDRSYIKRQALYVPPSQSAYPYMQPEHEQRGMFLVTPQSAFQSARNRQQRIHDIHTHTRKVDVGCQGTVCQTMNGHTENILGLIMSTYCDICLGEEASQSISAPSPLCARIFGQFSFPMPISLFRPRSRC